MLSLESCGTDDCVNHRPWGAGLTFFVCLVLLPSLTVAGLLCVYVEVQGAGRQLFPGFGVYLIGSLQILQPLLACFIAAFPLWSRRLLETAPQKLPALTLPLALLAGGLLEIDFFLATPGLLPAALPRWHPLPRPLLWLAFFLLIQALLLTLLAFHRPMPWRAPGPFPFYLPELVLLLPLFLSLQFSPPRLQAVENPDPRQAMFSAETDLLNALHRYRHFTGNSPSSLEELQVKGYLAAIPWNPWNQDGHWEILRDAQGRIRQIRAGVRRRPSYFFPLVAAVQVHYHILLILPVLLLITLQGLLRISSVPSSFPLRLLIGGTEILFAASILLLALGCRPLWVIMTGASWPIGRF